MVLAAAAFALALGTAYLVTPLTSRVAHRFGVIDRPDVPGRGYKRHGGPTPYLGGLAIYCGTAVGAAMLIFLRVNEPKALVGGFPVALALALGLGILGLLDDIRPVPRSIRLTVQVLAALVAWALGFQVRAFAVPGLDFLVTMLWIVGITNAFNLLDNMDGLLAGIAGIAGFSFAIMAILGHLSVLAVVASALAGAALGFLAHNRHPARIFMGDAGSLFLGFLLALMGVRLKFNNLVEVTFLVPVVVLGIPILDTTLVVVSRLRHGRPPFVGSRDHISHRLIKIGLPVRVAVGLLYWSGLCLGWLGLVISRADVQVGWMLLGFVVALGIFFGALLWNVPVYEVQSEGAQQTPSRTRQGRGVQESEAQPVARR